jgi:hypothetical protein
MPFTSCNRSPPPFRKRSGFAVATVSRRERRPHQRFRRLGRSAEEMFQPPFRHIASRMVSSEPGESSTGETAPRRDLSPEERTEKAYLQRLLQWAGQGSNLRPWD